MLFRSSSIVLAGALAVGCSRMLGIDGTYVLQEDNGGGASDTGGSTSEMGGAGTGGLATGGSTGSGTGGTVVTGGTSAGATGGTTGAGGSPDAGAGCQPGHYAGSLTGAHRPSVTFVGVPSSVQTGTIGFDLAGSGGALSIQLGVINAKLTSPIVQDAGTLTATLTGSLDCTTRTLHGTLTGHVDVVNVVSSPVAGTWEGAIDTAGSFNGTWTEVESVLAQAPDAGTCTPGTGVSQPVGTGCGTWNAKQ